MSLVSFSLVLLSLLPAQESARAETSRPAVRIQKLRIPADRLSEFLPKDEITHYQAESEIDRLVHRYNSRVERPPARQPAACLLQATLNLQTSRLVGKATWGVPEGRSNEVKFTPWELSVQSLSTADDAQSATSSTTQPATQSVTVWGLNETGDLLVKGIGPGAMNVGMDWELVPRHNRDRWTFEVSLPSCAIASLELTLPKGWKVRSTAKVVEPENGSDSFRLYFGGLSRLAFELLPPSTPADRQGVLTWESEQTFRFEEQQIELFQEIKLEALVDRADRMSLLVDKSVRLNEPRLSTPARWRREDAGPERVRWIAEFRRPPLGPFRLSFRSVFPASAGSLWRPPLVVVENAAPRGEVLSFWVSPELRIASVSPGKYQQTFTGAQDGGYLLTFANPQGADNATLATSTVATGSKESPSIKVVASEPEVDVRHEVFLDIARERLTLTGRIEWHCLRGVLYQPKVWIPPDWDVTKVKVDPDRMLSYRSEPAEDGGVVVSIPLGREGLSAGQRVMATIIAESPKPLALRGEELEYPLPEIRPLGLPPTGPSVYCLSIDSNLPYSREGLPPLRSKSIELPGVVRAAGSDRYCFDYTSPQDIKLTILAQAPRYAVDCRQSVRREGATWLNEVAFDVSVQQGLPQSFPLTSSLPLPKGYSWKVDGPANSVEVLPEQADASGPPYQYRLKFAVPLERQVKVRGVAETSGPSFDVPLFSMPAAEGFLATVRVCSQLGQTLKIAAEGLADSEPSKETEQTSPDGLIWTVSYSRLPEEARVMLSLPESSAPAPEAELQGEAPSPKQGKAVISCRSMLDQARDVHELSLWLDCQLPGPLRLRLPADSYVWRIVLDGESQRPRATEDGIEIVRPVSSGLHALKIVYSQPSRGWWGLPATNLLSPLPDWEVTSFVWEMERLGPAHVLSARRLQQKSHLRSDDEWNPSLELIAGTQNDPATRTTTAVMESAYRAAPPPARLDVADALVGLVAKLPPGWIVLFDRQARLESRGSSAPEGGSSESRTFIDWIARRGLELVVIDRVIVLTDRRFAPVGRFPEAPSDATLWFGDLMSAVECQGTDPVGRFVTPALLLGRQASDPMTNVDSAPSRSRATTFDAWTFESRDGRFPSAFQVIFIPTAWLEKLSRLLALGGGLALLISGWRWPIPFCRRALIVALALVVVVQLAGGFLEGLLIWPAWTGLIIAAILLVKESRRPSLETAVAGLALFFLPSQQAVSQPASGPPLHRVLVPYDPQEPARRTNQAVITGPLWDKLQNPPPATGGPLLIKSLELTGKFQPPNQVRWLARMQGFADLHDETSVSAPLDFLAVQPLRVTVDGKETSFLPAGKGTSLDIRLTKGGPVAIEVEFLTPLLGVAPQQELDFGIPAAPRTDFQLFVVSPKAQLTSDSEPKGIEVTPQETTDKDPAGSRFAGRLGPTRRIRLRWRDAQIATNNDGRVSVTSAQLLDVGGTGRDLVGVFRFELGERVVDQLSFSLGPSLLVRRIDAAGLVDWRVTEDTPPSGKSATDASLRRMTLQFESPRTRSVDVRIHCLVRPSNPGTIQLPQLAPLDVHKEEGIVGFRAPLGASLSEKGLRNAEPASQKEFLDEWERLGQAPIDQVVLARRYRQRPLEMTLALQRPVQPWSVEQTTTVQPRPFSKLADVTSVVVLRMPKTSPRLIQFKLPKDFELQRVTGAGSSPGLYQWFQEQQTVTVLPEKEIVGEWTLTLTGSFKASGQPKPAAGAIQFPISGFEWPGAERTTSQWRILVPERWSLDIGSLQQAVARPPGPTERIVESASPRHSFLMTLQPIAPKVDVRSVTAVTVKDHEVVAFEGRFDLNFSQGPVTRLEIQAPTRLRNLRFQIDGSSLTEGAPRGNNRIWVLEPAQPMTGERRIDWQASQKILSALSLPVPDVKVVDHAVTENWIVLNNRPEPTLAPQGGRGVTQATLPEKFSSWPAGFLAPASPGDVTVFRVDQSDWRLTLEERRQQRSTEVYSVRNGRLELLQSSGGTIQGISRWQIRDHSAGVVAIEMSPDCHVDRLLVDGQPLPGAERLNSQLRFPLFRKSDWQEVTLYWSAPFSRSYSQLPLPSLTAGPAGASGAFPILIRVRGAEKSIVDLPGQALDRSQWLLVRYARFVEHLADSLKRWSDQRSSFTESEQVIDLLVAARQLEVQFDEAIRLQKSIAPSLAASLPVTRPVENQFKELLGRRDELVEQFQARPLANRAASRPANASGAEAMFEEAASDRADYSLATSPLISLSINADPLGWDLLPLPSNRTVVIVAALAAMVALSFPGFWPFLRLYWPAPLCALGIAWLRWGQPAPLGLLALAASLYGAWSIAGRWFEISDSITSAGLRRDSSLINRPGANIHA